MTKKLAWMDIPPGWEVDRAKYIFRQMNRPVRPEDEIVTAFRDGTVTLRSNRRTEGFTNSVKEIGYQGVRKGDLVIHAMDGFAGAIGVSDSDGKCTPVYSICQPIIPASNYYYSYIIRFLALNGYIVSLARGIRERSTEFRYKEFREVELPIPPIDIQNEIVSYLQKKILKIDALITKYQFLIEHLEEKCFSLIHKAVTKGLDDTVCMADMGIPWLGKTPDHWEIKKIKDVSKILRGRFSHRPRNDPKLYDGSYPFIQTGDVASAKKFITTYKQTLNDKGYEVSAEFPMGTLVMTIAANIGDTAILRFNACFPDSIVGLIPIAQVFFCKFFQIIPLVS